jgi:predicted nucleic acid-binding protein
MNELLNIDKIVAVSNTGPLISALQCERIDLLKHYFAVLYITDSERAELEKHGWANEIRGVDQ